MDLDDTSTSNAGQEAFTNELYLINLHNDKAYENVLCRWRFCNPAAYADGSPYFYALDLLFKIVPTSDINLSHKIGQESPLPRAIGTPLEKLVSACYKLRPFDSESEVALKVLLVPKSGYLCRDDVLDQRTRHSVYIESVIHLSASGNHFPAITSDSGGSLLTLLSSSPGALLAKPSADSRDKILRQLDEDLQARFSFDWILPLRPTARTVAVVGGRPTFDIKRGSYASRGPFEAARALGISLIVLDRPGHWLEDDTYSHLRDDFIAIDTSDDDRLPLEIEAVLSGRRVDGIVTFSDEYVIATAKAAELLGLISEPVQAILQAHYKDETRTLFSNPNIQVLRLDDAEHLDDPAMIGKLEALRYPLVTKPCRGAASRGVKKVHDYAGMRQAVQMLKEDGLAKNGILLETYVDGPEVDANLVLWDGELLFFEITDDFPCLADATDATIADNFVETLMFLPSRLAPEEIEKLKVSLHQRLLELGFRSGVFHVEARVQNSSMSYQKSGSLLDLADAGGSRTGAPEVFLIEVNARPPGLSCNFATLYTYGIDLCALHLLRALGDDMRFKALTKPFTCRAQYWCANCQIPIHREKIFVPDDFFERVDRRLPEIAAHVSGAEFFVYPGNVVSPVKGVGFIAYFLLYSRHSREHVLRMCADVQDVSKLILDGN